MRNFILHTLLVSFLVLVSLAGLQGSFGFFQERELTGGRGLAKPGTWAADSVWSGAFQSQTLRYLDDRMGFRNSLVRLNSQLNFAVLRMSVFRNVVIGRDHFLFEGGYVDSYLGKNYAGRYRIYRQIGRLKTFQDVLARKNVRFLLVLCPSKARFMPENLPAAWRHAHHPDNYDTYAQLLPASGVHYLDLNRWFLQLKDTCRYTLYPHGGNHWTTFSSRYYVLDTLLRALEHLSGKRYARVVNDRLWWTDSLASPDDDLSILLNLIRPFPKEQLPYAEAHADTAGCTRPGVLVIGDSYFWQIYGYPKLGAYFRPCDFWAWNEQYYPLHRYRDIPHDHYVFFRNEILRHEFVILMVTEINLATLLDFDERTFLLFDPSHALATKLEGRKEERIAFYRQLILHDPKWKAVILQKAEARNIPFEKMLENDAAYMAAGEIRELRRD